MTTTCISCLLCEQFSPTKRTLVERRCRIDEAPRDAASRTCYFFQDSRSGTNGFGAKPTQAYLDAIVRTARRILAAGRPLYGFPSLPAPVPQGDTRRPTMPAELL